jgi:hypothetical protein
MWRRFAASLDPRPCVRVRAEGLLHALGRPITAYSSPRIDPDKDDVERNIRILLVER